MTGRMIAAAIGIILLCGTGMVRAQENLDQGKTPAQLFASDCAICHKSPRGLSRAGGVFGLQNFLRAHYTASVQSATALAAYLQAVDRQAPPPRKRTTRRPPTDPPAPKARPKAGEPEKSAQPDGSREAAKPDADKPAAEAPAEAAPAGPDSSEARSPSPEGASKPAAGTGPESGSETMSGAARDEPGPDTPDKPATGAGDSVPDIIKPEKTE